MEERPALSVRLIGELEVERGPRKLALPPSRKTRALLAYLLLTRRAHRRERLCSLLWDVADDPRGALRWSLSKLRPLVDEPGRARLVADRESVSIDGTGFDVDAFALERALAEGLEALPTERLEALASAHRGELLEGLDLPDFEEYQAWCIAEREQARARYVRLLGTLLARLSDDPTRSLVYSRSLARVEPMSVVSHERVLSDLAALGRLDEASRHLRSVVRTLEALAPERTRALEASWVAIRARLRPSPELPPIATASAPPPAIRPASSDAVPNPRPSAGEPRFVGRSREVERATLALDSARGERRVRAVLFVGEPGIGKTRLLDRALASYAERGAIVARGRSWEVESGRPYAPWTSVLRQLDESAPGERLDPSVLSFVDGTAEAANASEAQVARERAFAAIVGRLRAIVEAAPLVLAFDDLQWCDEASAVLIHLVTRSLRDTPLVLALTARAGELVDNGVVMRTVRSLRREATLTQIALAPLDETEIAALVHDLGSTRDAASVHASSGGNPLYAIELARAEVRDESLPDSLASLVRDRIDRLAPEAREVLAYGAVLGRRFDVELMSALVRLDDVELDATLRSLEREQLVGSVESERPSYAFLHDAVRAVVYADLSGPRRKLMHRRVAELLEPRAPDGEEQASLVAHHALLGGAPERAARACVEAGRRAVASLASATAESFGKRGLRCASGLPERIRVPLTVELYQVLFAARRPTDVESLASELSGLAERSLVLGDVEHARLGYQLLGYLRWEGGDVPDAQRHLLEAEWVTRGAIGVERLHALAEAGRCLALLERNLPEAEGYLLEANALAKQLVAEPASLVDASALLACHRGDAVAAMQGFERARWLARREGDRSTELQVLEHEVMCAIDAGAFEKAEERAEELSVLAEKARGGSELPAAEAFVSLARHLRSLEDAFETRLAALRTADSKRRLAFVLSRAALVDASRGAFEIARERAREALDAAKLLDRRSDVVLAATAGLDAAIGLADRESEVAFRAIIEESSRKGLSAIAARHARRVLGAGAIAVESARESA